MRRHDFPIKDIQEKKTAQQYPHEYKYENALKLFKIESKN